MRYFSSMRIHCKFAAIVVCLGVFLLLYFFGGNSADEPPPTGAVYREALFPFSPGVVKSALAEVVRQEDARQIGAHGRDPHRGGDARAKIR